MRKFRRQGRLIRKQPLETISNGEFGVIGVDSAQNTAWTEKHFNSLGDAVADMAMTGYFNFRDFANSVI